MQRIEYTFELGWKTFKYDKKDDYYTDFDLACEKFKYKYDDEKLRPVQILIFSNKYDCSNQGVFKIINNWGLYPHFMINQLSRKY